MASFSFTEIFSLPKSLYFCLRSMPLRQAVRIPVLVSRRTVLRSVSGRVTFEKGQRVRTGMVRIGFDGSGTARHLPCCIENCGTMHFGENVRFGGGCQICTVNENSVLSVGSRTTFTGECHIVARKSIRVGSRCTVSWNTQLMDTDLHKILSEKKVINEDREIRVGDHTWICSRAVILKGADICPNTIVAAGATIAGTVEEEKTVVTGLPLRVIRRGCEWKA